MDIIREVKSIALGDRRKLFDNNGNPLPLCDIDEDTAKMISEFEVSTNENGSVITKIKTYDKLAALEKMFKNLGMYEKHNEQQRDNVVTMSDEQLITAAKVAADAAGLSK